MRVECRWWKDIYGGRRAYAYVTSRMQGHHSTRNWNKTDLNGEVRIDHRR
jgi:hypothetical protein